MKQPKKIPVMSLKGGTGKTTTCLDISRTLRDLGYKVGLLDIDIHASALPRALNLQIPPGYEPQNGGTLQPLSFDGFKLFSIGLLFPEKTANMWDGPTKTEAVRQIATSSIDWGENLDFIVIDTPPTSGDEIQSLLANLENVYGAVVICQPNDLALLALAKTLDVLTETQTPIAGIVANMTWYQCPKCGNISNPFDRTTDDIKQVAFELGVKFLGEVPFGKIEVRKGYIENIVQSLLEHKPVTLEKKKGGIARWLMARILT